MKRREKGEGERNLGLMYSFEFAWEKHLNSILSVELLLILTRGIFPPIERTRTFSFFFEQGTESEREGARELVLHREACDRAILAHDYEQEGFSYSSLPSD